MRVLYQNTLRLTLPLGWVAEESENSLACFHPRGEGALTVSLNAAETGGETLTQYLILLAKRYIKQNEICLTSRLIPDDSNPNCVFIFAEGEQPDGWKAAFRFVSNGRQVAMFTYLCQSRTREWNKAVKIAANAVFIG
ncbi:hypothetical protein SDC9_78511 [bioreactor metagenome]|uniref:DUF1795 domain-containing protein n=1 Tax=bioreactor metagenome TaxID=1076179 RepID=A0A644Z188_9ZZZZ